MLKNLKAVRTKQALSMRDLSAKSGVSTNTLVRLEAGEEATFVTIRKLASALGVEPAELMGDD